MTPPARAPGLGLPDLVAPLDVATFLREVSGRQPRHFRGAADRFEALFSFDDLNRLIDMWRLWSDRTFKVVLDGRELAGEEFCVPGQGREGAGSMLVDGRRVEALLARGATVVLDVIESLSPAVAILARRLESALGATVGCNAYCSFRAHAGFPSHYDTTDVFALHIAGEKRWRVYEGRADRPVEHPGHAYPYQPPAHHEQAKGKVRDEVLMAPGDVLYLPRGQYHDALAASGASLHLSFSVTRPTALDFMSVVTRSLPDEGAFRAELPHFDDTRALARHLAEIADRLGALVREPGLVAQVAAWQRERVFRDLPPAVALPASGAATRVRVRRGAGIQWDGRRLVLAGADVALSPGDAPVLEWMLRRDVFLADELVTDCALSEPQAGSFLDRLARAGVIEPV